jgi:hypothetical protein
MGPRIDAFPFGGIAIARTVAPETGLPSGSAIFPETVLTGAGFVAGAPAGAAFAVAAGAAA